MIPTTETRICYETILSGDLNADDGPDFENYGDNARHIVVAADTRSAASPSSTVSPSAPATPTATRP